MKKRLMYFMLALLPYSYGQAEIAPLNEVPVEITGVWQSFENDVVRISSTGEFIRIYDKKVAAEGVIVLTEDGSLEIKRTDVTDTYELRYFIRNDIMVISKPRSNSAWLFYRVGY